MGGIVSKKQATSSVSAGKEKDEKDIALIKACERGETELLTSLLKSNDANINAKDRYGRSLLILACEKGHEDIAKLLIDQRAELEARCLRDGATALIRNACVGNVAINNYLIQASAGLNIQDKEGKTALMCAVEFNHSDIALALVRAGAGLDIQSTTGRSALFEVGGEGLLLLLLPLSLLETYITYIVLVPMPLLVWTQACVEHRDELSLALMAAGAAVDLADQDGRTALIEAAADHEDRVARALISHGANVNAQDRSGRSALIVVRKMRVRRETVSAGYSAVFSRPSTQPPFFLLCLCAI